MNRWLILTEFSLILLPFGLLIFSDQLQISRDSYFWILISCIFSTAVTMLALWLSRKRMYTQDPDLIRTFLFLIPVLQYGFILVQLIIFRYPGLHPDSFVTILLGLMFIILGNLLPKSTQNPVFGVRTRWTLANRENWNRTSQISGKIWVIGGLLCWAAIFFRIPSCWNFTLILVCALAPMAVSWGIYKIQLKNGSWQSNSEEDSDSIKMPPALKKFALFLIICLLAFCTWAVTAGKEYSIRLDHSQLHIETLLVSDRTIELDQTESLILKPADDPGDRLFGYSAFGTDLGTYENDEYGRYYRYTSNSDIVIELRQKGGITVISESTDQKTRELFERIAERIKQNGFTALILDELNETI